MADAHKFPISYPGDVRPSLAGEDALRRFGKQLAIAANGKALGVGAGAAPMALYLARELGSQVVVVDVANAALTELSDRVKAHGLEQKISVHKVETYAAASLPFADGEFRAIVIDPSAPAPLEQLFAGYRRLLAPRGRLMATYPVRVGRFPNTPLIQFWEQKLGEPLPLPRDVLQVLERAGYEPQIIETLDDAAMDDFYRKAEQHAAANDEQFREELSHFQSQGGRTTVSFAVAVGRRKDPGEKPPPSRNE